MREPLIIGGLDRVGMTTEERPIPLCAEATKAALRFDAGNLGGTSLDYRPVARPVPLLIGRTRNVDDIGRSPVITTSYKPPKVRFLLSCFSSYSIL